MNKPKSNNKNSEFVKWNYERSQEDWEDLAHCRMWMGINNLNRVIYDDLAVAEDAYFMSDKVKCARVRALKNMIIMIKEELNYLAEVDNLTDFLDRPSNGPVDAEEE